MHSTVLLTLFIVLCVALAVPASPVGTLEQRGKRPARPKAPVAHPAPKTKTKIPARPPSLPHSPIQGSSGDMTLHPVKVKTKPKASTSSPSQSRPQSPVQGGTVSTGKRPVAGTRPPSRAGSTSSNHGSPQSHPQSPSGEVFNNEFEACKEFKSCTTCVMSEADVMDSEAAHDPKGKGKLKTVRAKCGWKLDPNSKEAAKGKGSCLPVENGPASLLTTKEQCAQHTTDTKASNHIYDADEEEEKNNASRLTYAKKEWAQIMAHVINGGDSRTSGRHAASEWFKRNKLVPLGSAVNHDTGLGEVPYGSANEKKTLWLDVKGPLKPDPKQNLSFRGPFTEASIAGMCVEAFAYSMKANDNSPKTPLPASHNNPVAFAVKAPNGHTICIELSGASCYPNDIKPASKAPGQPCATSRSDPNA